MLMRVRSSTTAAKDPLGAVSRLWNTCPPLDATVFCVGVFCSLEELERQESSRGDGGVEGRPLGLARRSDELCHSHGLKYDVTVWTDTQTAADATDAIVAALRAAGCLPWLTATAAGGPV